MSIRPGRSRGRPRRTRRMPGQAQPELFPAGRGRPVGRRLHSLYASHSQYGTPGSLYRRLNSPHIRRNSLLIRLLGSRRPGSTRRQVVPLWGTAGGAGIPRLRLPDTSSPVRRRRLCRSLLTFLRGILRLPCLSRPMFPLGIPSRPMAMRRLLPCVLDGIPVSPALQKP